MTSLGIDGTVEFRFYRPDASTAWLMGDFLDWKRPICMQRDSQGWWVARVPLPPGEYQFRYVADGTWYTDFASHGIEVNASGCNSLLFVPDRAPQAVAAA